MWLVGVVALFVAAMPSSQAACVEGEEALGSNVTFGVSDSSSFCELDVPSTRDDDYPETVTPPDQPSRRGAQPQHGWLAKVEHRMERPKGETWVFAREKGLATVVGEHTVLTHGHYLGLGDESYRSESMVLCFAATGCLIQYHVQMDGITISFADAGVTLLVLPERVHLPKAAPLGDPGRLRAGDKVSVLYWDDAHRRFAALETAILDIEGGVAEVADPSRVIGSGDSGSGMYNAQGQLVGNVWSVLNSGSGVRLPRIEVSLLPAGIGRYIS